MKSFLEQIFLDNTIKSYLIAGGSLLLIILFKRLLSRFIAGLLYGLVKRVAVGVDKALFVKLVVSPLEVFLLMLLGVIVLDKLTFPRLLNVIIYKVSVKEFIDAISVIVLIITFIWLLLRIMDFIAMILHHRADQTVDPSDNQLVVFFKDFFKVVLVMFGIILILKFAFHYPVSNLLTGLSIATAAIALATRESLENLIASFIIFFDKPFTMGDTVKVQNITGSVERIGLRSTRIRTDEKTYVTVPNKQMVDSIMDNLSLRTQRRVLMPLELAAETPRDTLNLFVQRLRGLLAEKKDKVEHFHVFVANINKNTYVVHVEYFVAPVQTADFYQMKQDINLPIIGLLEELGVKLASKEGIV